MEKYNLINLVLGIIIGMIVSALFFKTVQFKRILGFLSQRPELNHIYEFKFRLSPKHGVFYSPVKFQEFIFVIDVEDKFMEEHYYSYRQETPKFGYLGSLIYESDWYKVAYP